MKKWVVKKEPYRNRDVWVIRQGAKRLPIAKYKRIQDDYTALVELVARLNAPLLTKEKVNFKHAFINEDLIERFRDSLRGNKSEKQVGTEIQYLKDYGLDFFIGKQDLMNPLDWQKHSDRWTTYLLSPEVPPSGKAKRDIIRAMNNFLRWLHVQRPEEVPLIILKPVADKKLREIDGDREANGKKRQSHYIPPGDWKRIKAAMDGIGPHLNLGYHYGLRRNEILGVKPGDVHASTLHISRQLVRLGEWGATKGRAARKVPHWFCTPADAHKWAKAVQAAPMHPRTLSARFDELMAALKLPYSLHDLRHTFITNAVDEHRTRDVQLAAGHVHITTTEGYIRDKGEKDDDVFVPDAA